MAALMACRKAKGLCYKCGLKWGPNHQCAESVPLHVVEELWQMLNIEGGTTEVQAESDSEEDLMAISAQADSGSSDGRTIKLFCHVYKHPAVILVYSGSGNNFISEHLASFLSNWKPLPHPVKVKIADGKILLCTHEIPDCDWLVQGVTFKTTFKILPLKCYDAILGMDWLVQFSPIEVQWAEKWLSFLYQGQRVQLKGIPQTVNSCPIISESQLATLQEQGNTY